MYVNKISFTTCITVRLEYIISAFDSPTSSLNGNNAINSGRLIAKDTATPMAFVISVYLYCGLLSILFIKWSFSAPNMNQSRYNMT